MATQPNGISALQLQRELSIGSYKTAWLLCAKLRNILVARSREPLSGLVEVAATEIACQRERIRSVEIGRDRVSVGGAVEVRELGMGRVRLFSLTGRWPADLSELLRADLMSVRSVATSAAISGGRGTYIKPNTGRILEFASGKPDPNTRPWLYRVFSRLIPWLRGTYCRVARKYLQSYLDEFAFRFEHRRSRNHAFAALLQSAAGHQPLTYATLISPAE